MKINWCRIFHDWHTVMDTGTTAYMCCARCGKREATQFPGGHQPIDTGWIETGEWTEPGKPPTGRSGVTGAI